MLNFTFTYNNTLDEVGERIRGAVAEKLGELTLQLFNKVHDNLSGKILQKQSGQLIGSIFHNIEEADNEMIGVVSVDPASPKAWALEKGGSEYYPITPVKANLLHWVTKEGQHAFAKHVLHPPSKEFGYLRLALEEMAPMVPTAFLDAIAGAVLGSA